MEDTEEIGREWQNKIFTEMKGRSRVKRWR
jgi:hypothetical protein